MSDIGYEPTPEPEVAKLRARIAELEAERATLKPIAARVDRAERALMAVADHYGDDVCDSIDNDGHSYQSAWLNNCLVLARHFQGES